MFTFSQRRRWQIKQLFPEVVEGGTGYGQFRTLDDVLETDAEAIVPNYQLWPEYPHSIGFTSRGCRLSCKFCVVPRKEGKPKTVHSIYEIWRGKRFAKNILLLDNDFFGQPEEQWKERVNEIVSGGFRVSFNQGINVRMINEVTAWHIARLDYRDDQFKTKRLYTAWDNLKDEERFKSGVACLLKAGVKTSHLMVYMLIGYSPGETEEQILYRFNEIVALGCRPFPMCFDNKRRDLKAFQRWAIRRYYEFIPWKDYQDSRKVTFQHPVLIPCP